MLNRLKALLITVLIVLIFGPPSGHTQDLDYVIVDTDQDKCFDNQRPTNCPRVGQDFYGQDAQYQMVQPSYRDNEDGTITDNNTGLQWQKTPNNFR